MAEAHELTRDRLLKELAGRRPDITKLYNYYRGDHPVPWAPDEVRDAYRALMRMSRSNWCRLIVQAPQERLRVVGIRFSETSDSLPSDVEMWKRLWQSNRMDAEMRLVFNAALVARRGFTLTWPSMVEGAPPSITPEHPSQVIVGYKPGSRRIRTAGLKTFVDKDAEKQYATLWTDEAVYNWVAGWSKDSAVNQSGEIKWEPWSSEPDGIYPAAENPLGEVPLIEFVSGPTLGGEPMGELDGGVLDVQDRINKTVLDRLVSSNFASFKQKWATGLEIPKDDDGNDIEPYALAVNRLLVAENPETKFGEFSETDLANYIASEEADVQHLAATTRTPPHYLLGQSGAFPSGDSLKATETGLVARCNEITDSLTESGEDALRLALKADGDPRWEDYALSLVWKNPESRSDAEKYDAATKMQAVQVPWRSIMEYLGYTPTEIERMDLERAEDAANGLLPDLSVAPPI